MNGTLEVVVVPVSDVDAAEAFGAAKVGFDVDQDVAMGEGQWLVPLTPSGSGCSVVIGSSWSVQQLSSRAA